MAEKPTSLREDMNAALAAPIAAMRSNWSGFLVWLIIALAAGGSSIWLAVIMGRGVEVVINGTVGTFCMVLLAEGIGENYLHKKLIQEDSKIAQAKQVTGALAITLLVLQGFVNPILPRGAGSDAVMTLQLILLFMTIIAAGFLQACRLDTEEALETIVRSEDSAVGANTRRAKAIIETSEGERL